LRLAGTEIQSAAGGNVAIAVAGRGGAGRRLIGNGDRNAARLGQRYGEGKGSCARCAADAQRGALGRCHVAYADGGRGGWRAEREVERGWIVRIRAVQLRVRVEATHEADAKPAGPAA